MLQEIIENPSIRQKINEQLNLLSRPFFRDRGFAAISSPEVYTQPVGLVKINKSYLTFKVKEGKTRKSGTWGGKKETVAENETALARK